MSESILYIHCSDHYHGITAIRCAYVLICEADENRLLAENMLHTITRLMTEYVTSFEQKNAEVSTLIHMY